jgi:hypothetical protein
MNDRRSIEANLRGASRGGYLDSPKSLPKTPDSLPIIAAVSSRTLVSELKTVAVLPVKPAVRSESRAVHMKMAAVRPWTSEIASRMRAVSPETRGRRLETRAVLPEVLVN